MSIKRACGLLVLVVSVATTPALAQQTEPYVIVVNARNPISSMSAEELARVFLKKQKTWEDGSAVLPVDLPEDSQVRETFTRDVLGRSTSAVRAFWQQMIFSGRDVLPVVRDDPGAVISYVSSNTYAIGYVAPNTPLDDQVKVVEVYGGG